MKKFLVLLILISASVHIYAQKTTSHRPKVGLVLGGGGAMGAAEVGALKVLEKTGIPIDYIAGTSIGSIVGGLYACGYRADSLENLFVDQNWLNLFSNRKETLKDKILGEDEEGTTYLFGFPIFHKKKPQNDNTGFGMLSANAVTHMLDSLTSKYDHIESFDQLPIPFRCVAVDINGMEEVWLDSCELELAMRASMAIPGVFRPIKWKGHTLVDGGMLNNLPVDVVKAMGADVVIAIDLTQDTDDGSDFSLRELTGIGGLANWLLSRPDRKQYSKNVKLADVVIAPDLEEFSAASFSLQKVTEMIDRGADAARDKWDELMQLKAKVCNTSTSLP